MTADTHQSKAVRNGMALIIFVIGVIVILQGFGLVHGRVLSQPQWLGIGAILAATGLTLLASINDVGSP